MVENHGGWGAKYDLVRVASMFTGPGLTMGREESP